jgi:hypothetical protein
MSGLADFPDGIEEADRPPEQLGNVMPPHPLDYLSSPLLSPSRTLPGSLLASGVWRPGALR